MATKYGPRKKHNAGTVRSSTTTHGGSRTRKTVTVKTGNYTRSRSVNKNGTVRQTTTHKSPSGFWTRTTKTIGSRPSKSKAPKFVKVKPFKLPKIRVSKTRSTSRSRSRSSGGDFLLGLIFAPFEFILNIILLPFRIVGAIIAWIFMATIFVVKWGLIITVVYYLLKWLL